ncbi:MAG: hypothetical protein WAP74_02800 [Patescibacteria group bacterium]
MPNSWQLTRVESSLQKKTVERVAMFRDNPFDIRLKTHKLTGKLKGDWAFSVDYHNRVRFRILDQTIALLIDVGSHDIYKH